MDLREIGQNIGSVQSANTSGNMKMEPKQLFGFEFEFAAMRLRHCIEIRDLGFTVGRDISTNYGILIGYEVRHTNPIELLLPSFVTTKNEPHPCWSTFPLGLWSKIHRIGSGA